MFYLLKLSIIIIVGTSDRNRTGTHYAADFKSAGSTYSPTLADVILYMFLIHVTTYI